MNEKYNKAMEILEDNNQNGVLEIFKKLDDEKKLQLAEEIINLNFPELIKLYNETKENVEILDKKIEHVKYVDKYKIDKKELEEYNKIGIDIIKNNQYAVVTMAGGQGTRLGHKGPKGTFKIDVKPEPKYLFEIIAENLEKENKKYGITLPWYIMTSSENNKDTVKFFEDNNYFNYNKDYVKFFMQGNLPLLLENGEIILDKDYHIKEAADGNGCIYKAMAKNKILEDMKNRGVKWIFIGSVDNVLLNMVDPALIGLAIKQKNDIAMKSIPKNSPQERVGVACKINGKPSVIEYTELPEEMSVLRDENGELLYGEAHIMCNLYSMDALEKISKIDLPYHVAHKKSDYMDKNGEIVEAKQPNAYKFEAFIFDAFNYFDEISILRGKREEDFAPVKNKEGNDSPFTAKELYNNFHMEG